MQKGSANFTVDRLASLFWAIGGNWRPRLVTRAFKKRNAVKDVGQDYRHVLYTLLWGLGSYSGALGNSALLLSWVSLGSCCPSFE